jgi:hypothetical protein
MYEYTTVDTLMAINTDITAIWITVPRCSQGSTRNTQTVPHLPDYHTAVAHTTAL